MSGAALHSPRAPGGGADDALGVRGAGCWQAVLGDPHPHDCLLPCPHAPPLAQCTPDQLPPTLLHELEKWLVGNSTFLEGSARPGCVHLHFATLVSQQERERLVGRFPVLLQQLVASGKLGPAALGSMLAQQGGQAAVLDEGRALLSLDCAGQAEALPRLFSVRPLAVTPTYDGPFLATGRHISEGQVGANRLGMAHDCCGLC